MSTLARTPFLRRKQAADYIGQVWGIPISPRTLAKLAVVGGGPPFRKAGRFPMNQPADLDAWVERRLGPRQTSTSDRPRERNERSASAMDCNDQASEGPGGGGASQ